MAIVMNAKIQKFQYDKTIEARVVSTKYKADGIYKVEFEDAIFDAYSNDNSRYYEGDTVYVHVPKGDFSLQKHIVGRKVDIEKEPERTFTFKMPFDDFLSLEDLTYQDEKATQVHGYIANHPLHGIDNDSNDYNNEIININAKIQELRATYQKITKLINDYQSDIPKYVTPVATGFTISNQYPRFSQKSYLTIIEELLAQPFENILQLSQAVEQVKQQVLLGIKSYGANNKFINADEYDKIMSMIGGNTIGSFSDDYDKFLNSLDDTTSDYQSQITDELSSDDFLQRQNEILSDNSLTEEEKNAAIDELYNGNRQETILTLIDEVENVIQSTQYSWQSQDSTNFPENYLTLLEENGIGIGGTYEGAKARLIVTVGDEYADALSQLLQVLAKYTLLRADQEGAKEANINWLYTWTNDDDEPCLFDQLGVAADFQTLLGDYRPRQGTYGLKLIVRGMTKPTEDLASIERTETLYFLNNIDFYGNTYAFYNYYTQQKLFDVSNFQKLTRIDVYFWQDHRSGYEFKDELMKDIPWQINHQECPPNIMVSNVKLLMGVDANSFTTDKVFLYTYDNLVYGINPYTDKDRAIEDKRTLQFAWVHKLEDGSAELINNVNKLKEYNANIYWYQHEYGVAQDTSQYAWRQGGVNWKWLENQCSFDNGNQIYNKFSIDVFPDIAKAQEKYRVVLEYNNVPLRSESLVFTNVDSTIETHADDLVNEVVFRFLRENENGNLVEDDDIGVFNVYDESNLCIKDENNISYAAKWYYVQIWIRNNDTGEYTPLAIDDEDGSIEVIWGTDELANQSMINQFVAPTVSDLSTAVLLPTSPSYNDKINQNIINITRKFNIRSRLDMRYTHNNITAVVKRNGREYRLQKTLYFGQSGSMGSEYSITLHQLTPRGNCMVDNEPFSIYATVADKFGNKVENQAYHFTWELLSPTIITIGQNDPIEGLTWQNSVWTTGQEGNYANNKITGVIRNGMPLIIRVGVTNAADYPIYQTTAFRLVDRSGFNNLYNISVPDRVEFRSDGKAPIAITAPFYVSDIQNAPDDVIKEYYPQWKLRQWYKPTYRKDWNELVDSDGNPAPDFFSLNEKVVAKREVASNQNPLLWTVFIDENHTIPDYDSNVSTESFDGAEQVRYNYLITYIESAYNQAVITYQSSDQTEQDTLIYTEEKEKYENYLDKLNLAASKLVPSHTTYALNPYINNKANNSVAWYWDDALAENYYTIIEFQNDKDLPYYVRQAIAMTRNEYSSSLVNSWDGSLLVDKENNAFLSKMVSAGSKDQNNRFTGVMMGDWTDNADSSMQDVGLYGFSKGVQVFGLKTDGTGFIGKSGKGQIQFDGNYSLISNYDKSCYINLDPIKLTNENVFDTRTTMGYSPYFLYAKIPKKSTATIQGEGDLLESTYWVRSFMQDASNDYFIVDPNNGILTTGGIIARYGKIGNWLISSSGLYQRHTKKDEYGNSKDNDGHLMTDKFMYLGYPDRDLESEAVIRNKYSDVIDKINERRQREIDYERAIITNKVVDMLGSKYAKQIFVYDPMHYFNYGWPLLEVVNYLTACIDEFNETFIEGQNENDVLLDIIYDHERLKNLINVENYDRAYHQHYTLNTSTGEYESTGSQYYTGGASIYCHALGMNTYRRLDESSFITDYRFDYSNNKFIAFNETKWYVRDVSRYPNWWSEVDPATFQEIVNGPIKPKIISLNKYVTNLTIEELEKFIDILFNIYQYYLEGYNQSLKEMIDAGIADLTGEELQEYLQQKQEIEALYETTVIAEINKKYDAQLDEIEKQIQNDIIASDNGDNNRYAIYCGEDDIMHSELYSDPVTDELRPNNAFFTVDWTGTMMARKGILGYTSPWVIDDNGLTQKNKYGIIYLGAPKYSMEEDYDPNKTINGQDYNGQQSSVSTEIKNQSNVAVENVNQVYDQFIMFAGPKIAATPSGNLDNSIIPEHYANTIDEAYFALRADGTLFSRRGCIGSWYIGDTVLQTLWRTKDDETSLYPYNIVFDAANAEIRLGGGRTIIYGNGKIVLSNPSNKLDRNLGTIELAGYSLQGWTVSNNNLKNYALSAYDASKLETEKTLASFQAGEWDWAYSVLGDSRITTYAGASHTSQIVNTNNVNAAFGTIINPNYFSIFEKDLASANEYPGVQLVTGQLSNLNDGQYGVVFYPTGTNNNTAVLGLPTKKWNIHAGQINAGSIKTNNLVLDQGPLFIQGEKVAMEPWVWNLYIDLLNRIKDLGNGGSGGVGSAKSGGNGIGDALANLNGKLFVKEVYADGTSIKTIGEKFDFTTNKDGGNGDTANADSTQDVTSRSYLTSANVAHTTGTVESFLNSQVETNQNFYNNIRDLQGDVRDLQSDINSLQGAIGDLQDSIRSLSGRIDNLNNSSDDGE